MCFKLRVCANHSQIQETGGGVGVGITTGGAHLGCLVRSSRVSSRRKGLSEVAAAVITLSEAELRRDTATA